MKIKLTKIWAGPSWSYDAGRELDVADDVGNQLIGVDAAVLVGRTSVSEALKTDETAESPKPATAERAVSRRRRRR